LQLSRKRHIGNDIVTIVFADAGAPFAFNPASVVSHFLRTRPIAPPPTHTHTRTHMHVRRERETRHTEMKEDDGLHDATHPHRERERHRHISVIRMGGGWVSVPVAC
jgi:hypothetical protein